MKKIFLLFFITILFLFSFSTKIQARDCNGETGIVRCGQYSTCPCGIEDFFTMLIRIYNFIVLDIATPLAVVAITVGGIFILISAGNANLMSKGKTILYSAIIGLCLVFGSYLIINFITCTTLGFCAWSHPF